MDLNILLLAMGSPFRQPSGVLRVWGSNVFGQLGLSEPAERYYFTPQQLGFASNWAEVATSSEAENPSSSAAIQDTGALFTWGGNTSGQLGLGLTPSSDLVRTPTQVGNQSWSKISGGDGFFVAIRSDGTLWSWGNNSFGQLGLGDTTNRNSPNQIGADSNWVAVAVANLGRFVFGIRSNGTLWAWGRNNAGQLGLGSTTDQSSPVQVGTDTNWAKVSCAGYGHTLALKTTGTLWSCGLGNSGQLGLGNTNNYNTFQQIGASADWVDVAAASGGCSFAVRSTGTLWSWGNGLFGGLGLGNENNYSTPQQIGTDTNWEKVFSSGSICATYAIKTNKTLFSWGFNSAGQLGLGNDSSQSSPVQVGVLTSWAKVGPGNGFVIGITYP